ncbi:MAG: hypothetical protein IH614_12645 [Desulfuromonadales bacterium]|nr:hypothetical protein [Desulfuromonadales bacterium]
MVRDRYRHHRPGDGTLTRWGAASAGTGAGVPARKYLFLFNRFARGEKCGGEGFGLGLFVVELLTEAHDGHVFVCSQPGQGSIFRLFSGLGLKKRSLFNHLSS